MQKKKDKSKKLTAPLIALIIGGVLLLAAAIYLAAGSRNNADGTPVLTVDQTIIDYGTVKYETPLSFKIRVTNNGDGVLRFTTSPYIEVLEGC